MKGVESRGKKTDGMTAGNFERKQERGSCASRERGMEKAAAVWGKRGPWERARTCKSQTTYSNLALMVHGWIAVFTLILCVFPKSESEIRNSLVG